MTEAASVHGEALYALAKDENKSDEMLSQLKALDEAFVSEPAFLRLLSAPNVSKIERKEILDTCFRGKVEPYLLNFLKILMEKGYIRQFSSCVQVFCERYNEDHGIIEVCAVTAIPMKESLTAALKAKLETTLSAAVELTCRVDPACMGGVLLELPGQQLDGTVKHRLERLAETLQNVAI